MHPSKIVPLCATLLVLPLAGRFSVWRSAESLTAHALATVPVELEISDTTPLTVLRAAALHQMGVTAFAGALAEFVGNGGLLTDELREPLNGVSGHYTLDHPARGAAGGSGGWPYSSQYPWRRLSWMDIRAIPERWTASDTLAEASLGATQESHLDNVYLELQGARIVLSVAVRHLDHPAPAGLTAAALTGYRSELYALAGYTDLFLADLFCSGIPLNTASALRPAPDTRSMYLQALVGHQLGYRPGSTTAQVYQAAVAQFDTALRLAGDSARLLNLARVGKGRAWLALSQYDSAAVAVAGVPRGFSYALRSFWNLDSDGDEVLATEADREGRNGLPYLSSGDPRTVAKPIYSDKGMGDFLFPAKFWPDSDRAKYQARWTAQNQDALSGSGNPKYEASQLFFPFTIASWEEAVLIRAEAALQQHPADLTWLHLLNQLRATASIPGTSHPNSVKLPPLRDPGTARGRLALVFAERAKWLFLTGHRQGDLRRLIREYHWPQDQVYPTGPYQVPPNLLPQVGEYGADVNLPVPPEELANPQFLGCLNRGA